MRVTLAQRLARGGACRFLRDVINPLLSECPGGSVSSYALQFLLMCSLRLGALVEKLRAKRDLRGSFKRDAGSLTDSLVRGRIRQKNRHCGR
jgi:hypothetical protein